MDDLAYEKLEATALASDTAQPQISIRPAPRGPKTLRYGRSIFILSIFQIAASFYLFGSELICMNLTSMSVPCHMGTGYWVSALCLANGVIGVFAYRRKTHALVVACLVLSIISAIASMVNFTTSALWSKRIEDERYYERVWKYRNNGATTASPSTPGLDFILALNVLVCLVAIASAISCVISSALMCCNARCCCGGDTDYAVVVMSVPNSEEKQSQVILVPTRNGKVPKLQLVQAQPGISQP